MPYMHSGLTNEMRDAAGGLEGRLLKAELVG